MKCYLLHFFISPVFLLLCLFISHPVYANKTSILIITDKKHKIPKTVSHLLKKELQKNKNIEIETYHYQEISKNLINQLHTSLIITLGVNALNQVATSDISTIHALIPKKTSHHLDLCLSVSCINNSQPSAKKYSIYLDQPLARQLKFITLLLPSAKNIGVLTADFSKKKVDTLLAEASKLNLTIINHHVKNENNISKELNKLIKKMDVLFTLPDPVIHNNNSIPYLLLSTYRYNIPVIGFSKSYVNAGAIAAIYSSPQQITRQISELAIQILLNSSPSEDRHFAPKYFSVAVNNNVAHSLELRLPDSQLIKSKLLQLEK